MPLDTNVFDKLKTFGDYRKADEEFQMRKALAAQQLQGGAIDTATKTGLYKAQAQAQAAGSGDQGIYDQTKQTLTSQGIDTSDWAPDVGTGAAQAQTALMAHSSLPGLISAQAKTSAATTAANTSQGVSTPTPQFGYGIGLNGQPIITSVAAPAAPSAPASSTSTAPAVSVAAGRAAPDVKAFNQLFAPQPADAQAAADVKYGAPQTDVTPNAIPGTTPGVPAQAQTPAPASQTVPVYTPPSYDNSKTPEWNTQNRNQAEAAFKLNNVGALKQAEELGKDKGANIDAANKAQELTQRLQQNLLAMKQLNSGVPSSGFLPGGAQTYWSQAMGAHGWGDKGAAATASNQWDQINNQQVISEIQQFLASGGGGARINQTLDKIMRAAAGINKNDLPESRSAQIDNALAEIQNKNVSAQNLANVGSGQPAQQYQPIPVTTTTPAPAAQVATPAPIANGAIADNPQTGESMVYIDGAWKPWKGQK